jgi:hypothetical protein
MARLRTHNNRLKAKEIKLWTRRLRALAEPYGLVVIPYRTYINLVKRIGHHGTEFHSREKTRDSSLSDV